MREETVTFVCELVSAIPPGRVMTYGDIARQVPHAGPRTVGMIMRHFGHSLPWWRVVGAGGRPVPGAEAESLTHYGEEGTPLKRTGTAVGYRVDYALARWLPDTEGEPSDEEIYG